VLTFTGVVGVQCGRSPRLLNEARTAFLTLVTTRIVLTSTDETQRVVRVSKITAISVTITHTPTTNGHVLDAVVVLDTHRHTHIHTATPVQ